eukprot:5395084-Amphidinium_carterae.1
MVLAPDHASSSRIGACNSLRTKPSSLVHQGRQPGSLPIAFAVDQSPILLNVLQHLLAPLKEFGQKFPR